MNVKVRQHNDGELTPNLNSFTKGYQTHQREICHDRIIPQTKR